MCIVGKYLFKQDKCIIQMIVLFFKEDMHSKSWCEVYVEHSITYLHGGFRKIFFIIIIKKLASLILKNEQACFSFYTKDKGPFLKR